MPVTIDPADGALGALALGGCSDHVVGPKVGPRAKLSADATKFWEASATIRWNEIAREQTLTHAISQQLGTRTFAYLSLAQYNAAVAAEDSRGPFVHIGGGRLSVGRGARLFLSRPGGILRCAGCRSGVGAAMAG